MCVKTILEYYSTFFPGKVLEDAIFPYIRIQLQCVFIWIWTFYVRPSFFNTYFVCVTERECVYVSICVLWRKGNVEMVYVRYRHREV